MQIKKGLICLFTGYAKTFSVFFYLKYSFTFIFIFEWQQKNLSLDIKQQTSHNENMIFVIMSRFSDYMNNSSGTPNE